MLKVGESETVVVLCDEILDFIEGVEGLEHAIFEHGVEFVLHASQNGIPLVNVQAKLLIFGRPI